MTREEFRSLAERLIGRDRAKIALGWYPDQVDTTREGLPTAERCRNGHRYTAETCERYRDGTHKCLLCNKESAAMHAERQRALARIAFIRGPKPSA